MAPDKIRAGLAYDEKVFGRQETIKVGDNVSFSKNPVGLNQVIDMMGLALTLSLVSLLNANYADGIDVSWIWDGNHA